MSAGVDGISFLTAFCALKAAAQYEPERLMSTWEASRPIQKLCDDIVRHVCRIEIADRTAEMSLLDGVDDFANEIAEAYRDYDDRWRSVVSFVANRNVSALLAEVLGEYVGDSRSRADGRVDISARDAHNEYPIISNFMIYLGRKGRHAPAPRQWNSFYQHITLGVPRCNCPPLPLILAANGCSPASKQSRLEEQLRWAALNGRLAKAMGYLGSVGPRDWQTASEGTWNTHHFDWPEFDAGDEG